MKTLGIKIVTLILAMFIGRVSIAADYYFSSSTGDDSRTAVQAQNPNTPWQSIEKLNMVFNTLKPGDRVYLKRGDTFYGTIHMNASGSSSAPIKIAAFGNGNDPIITSLASINDWRPVGNGIFESVKTIPSSKARMVLINNISHHVGRYPNSAADNGGYLRIESLQGSTQINSKQLSNTANWTGGDIVIRKNQWIIDTHRISQHSGSSIAFEGTGTYSAMQNYGFFVQNHIKTLDQYGEWFFDPIKKKISVHFENQDPKGQLVQIATLDYLMTKTYGASYITVENLHFRGANADLIDVSGGRDLTFQRVTLEFAADNGLLARSVVNLKILESTIRFNNNNGLFLRYGNTNAIVKNNLVENNALFQGGLKNGDMTGVGIIALDDNTIIEGNKVINTGYNGIYFAGNNTIVRQNLVDNFCLIKGDGGGIYTYVGNSNKNYSGRKVLNNIVLNGKGHLGGLPNTLANPRGMAEGIFLDDNSNGIEVSGNTIAHTQNSGIKLANTRNINVKNNLIYDTDHLITIANSSMGDDSRNNTIVDNILFAKDNLQNTYTIHTHKNDIPSMGTFNRNFFFRPLGDRFSIFTRTRQGNQDVEERFDLKKFTEKYGKDVNSSSLDPNLKQFEITTYKSSNLFTNTDFNQNNPLFNITQAQFSIHPDKIDGRTLQVVAGKDSFLFYRIGEIKKNNKYLVRFTASASKKAEIIANLRHSGSPWQVVSQINTIEIGENINTYETILEPIADIKNAGLVISLKGASTTYWIDKFEIFNVEANVINPEERILFEYNFTPAPKKIVLQGKYVDPKLRGFEGEITIAPFSGIALVQIEKPQPKELIADPQIKVSLPTKNEFSEKDSIQLTAEVINDSPTAISKVTFYSGLKEIGTVTKTPFKVTWTNPSPGDQYVWANAECAAGKSYRSEDIDIHIAKIVAIDKEKQHQDTKTEIIPTITNSPRGIYINTGSTRDELFQGILFSSEFKNKIFSSGNIESHGKASTEPLLQSQRFGKHLSYEIPVEKGTYDVITFHNEVYFGQKVPLTGANKRVYNIYIEGELAKKEFDLFVENSNKAKALIHKNVEITDGRLSISLQSVIGDAAISGIAIIPHKPEPPASNKQLQAIHINTGSTRSGTYKGTEFSSEFIGRYFSAGNIESNTAASSHTVMQSQRFAKSLEYNIPVENGEYKIITYHNEVYFGKKVSTTGPGRRVYSIEIEGKTTKDSFDLFVENNNSELQLDHGAFKITQGNINIKLNAIHGDAAISGISIVPIGNTIAETKPTENTLPDNGLYINTGSLKDANFRGKTFESDFKNRYFSSGNIEHYALASNEELLQSQRFAKNLTYNIPVKNGKYTVITFHNEVYFGRKVALTGPGRRVFDIAIEGKTVRKNFDLYLENENNWMELKFEDIEVKDRILTLQLVASIADAAISGIAIIPQDPRIQLSQANLRNSQIQTNESTKTLAQLTKELSPTLFPNPAKDYVNLKIAFDIAENTYISIHSMTGQLVMHSATKNLSISQNGYWIPLTNIKNGTYIISITNSNGALYREKLIIN